MASQLPVSFSWLIGRMKMRTSGCFPSHSMRGAPLRQCHGILFQHCQFRQCACLRWPEPLRRRLLAFGDRRYKASQSPREHHCDALKRLDCKALRDVAPFRKNRSAQPHPTRTVSRPASSPNQRHRRFPCSFHRRRSGCIDAQHRRRAQHSPEPIRVGHQQMRRPMVRHENLICKTARPRKLG
jgi:hypothetical protein